MLRIAEDAFSFRTDRFQIDAFAADQFGRFISGNRTVRLVKLAPEYG